MEMQPFEHERRPSPRTITLLSTPAALGGMGLLRFPYHQDELRNLVRSALDEDEAFNDLTTIATVVSDRHAVLSARTFLTPPVAATIFLAIIIKARQGLIMVNMPTTTAGCEAEGSDHLLMA